MITLKQHLKGSPNSYWVMRWVEGSETIKTANSKSLSYLQKLRKEWEASKRRTES